MHLGIIDLMHSQHFPKNWHFLSPDVHMYVYLSGGKKYYSINLCESLLFTYFFSLIYFINSFLSIIFY